jgi:hypothetical protein
MNIRFTLVALACATALTTACGGGNPTPVAPTEAVAVDAEDAALKFDASKYTTVNVTVDGVAVKLRQYRIVYVAKPVKMLLSQLGLGNSAVTLADPYAYQTMIVSVPRTRSPIRRPPFTSRSTMAAGGPARWPRRSTRAPPSSVPTTPTTSARR